MLRVVILMLSAVATLATAQTGWGLAGKVIDAEDGSGLGTVEVSLAKAGLRTTTAKNGTWTLGTVGVHTRTSRTAGRSESFLRVVDGRLLLRMDGIDIRGRRMENLPDKLPSSAAARSLDEVPDTLVYTREGFVQKKTPISTTSLTGIVDSLRRIRYEGWVDSSHANLKPDTLDAFLRGERTMTIRWSKKNWDHMMKTMGDSCGAFGTRGGDWTSTTTSKACSDGQNDYIEKSAMVWVPADIETDGQVWKNVGVRLKGNWSLQQAWTSKDYALPFRFNTDKYEDSLPTTKDQRFYGFKKISLFNAVQDPTSIRGPIASAIFRQFGVAAPYSAPVHLILKFGDTTKDVGAYEMVEIPDAALLKRNFGHDSGNLYKPLSKLEQFVDSEWADEDIEGDRADAKALIALLNAKTRTTDSAKWHRDLQAAIDVDGFLRWLAASTVINSWDSYGMYPHNYYLFNDKGRFRWITYDFGNSFNYVMGSRTSIWYDEANFYTAGGDAGTYPLIRYLLADKTYCETYRAYVTQAIAGPASVANFQALVDKYASWVSSVPSTTREMSTLRKFMEGRLTEVQKSLNAKSCPIK
jgi:hypothetical protein